MFCTTSLFAQTQYEYIESDRLGSRELKIQLPRNYEENAEKVYPLILVLDGDFLFEIVAGNVDYTSYWDDMPEAIVVGVNQDGTRSNDLFVSDATFFPTQDGEKFYEFLGAELVPFLDENFRVGDFKVAVGHGESANFINFFSFRKTTTVPSVYRIKSKHVAIHGYQSYRTIKRFKISTLLLYVNSQ